MKFRPGTSDENIFRSVVELNEYQLPDRFDPEDVIVDIGAHIGSFAIACLRRGAGKVLCFEPDFENYCLLRENLAEYGDRVETFHCAVSWISGIQAFSGPLRAESEINTGGGYLFESAAQDTYGIPNELKVWVPVLGIGEVTKHAADIFPGETIRLMKLDCEFSEWEILQSVHLDAVRQIVGEYHENRQAGLDAERLTHILTRELNFPHFKVTPHGDGNLGLFWASRDAH